MYRDEDQDFLFLDWEFAGFLGNPAVDIATWVLALLPKYAASDNQYLEAYWNVLIQSGVDKDDYPLDKLTRDYLTYGTAHAMARVIGFASFDPTHQQLYIGPVQKWFDLHPTLTPEDMTLPTYGFMDFLGWLA